jgi:hypothetical protein
MNAISGTELQETKITEVVSICSRQHMDVWKLTAPLMLKFLQADFFTVYVPSREVKLFRKISPPEFRVYSQDSLGVDYTDTLVSKIKDANNLNRLGWYAQQFWKIEALVNSSADRLVIWDADCVPVAPIELFDSKSLPIYMKATENNPAYFQVIEKLIKSSKVCTSSFVIPGFPITKSDLTSLIENLEMTHGMPWYEALLENIDFSLRSGFSETELLGTWVWKARGGALQQTEVKWERLGQSRFGYARSFTIEKILRIGTVNRLGIISFENWDFRGVKKVLRKIRNLITS